MCVTLPPIIMMEVNNCPIVKETIVLDVAILHFHDGRKSNREYLGGGFKYFFYFQLYLGKWSNLTNIFQMAWNHQLDTVLAIVCFQMIRFWANQGKGHHWTKLSHQEASPSRPTGKASVREVGMLGNVDPSREGSWRSKKLKNHPQPDWRSDVGISYVVSVGCTFFFHHVAMSFFLSPCRLSTIGSSSFLDIICVHDFETHIISIQNSQHRYVLDIILTLITSNGRSPLILSNKNLLVSQ